MVSDLLVGVGGIIAMVSVTLFGITYQTDIREPMNPIAFIFPVTFFIGINLIIVGWILI